jgi:uncharacterized membrane protein
MKTKEKTYLRVLGLGTVAGMRAAYAPMLLSHFLVRSPAGALDFSPLRYLQDRKVSIGLKVAAAAEIVVDKLPTTPNRTVPSQLSARVLSGALVGAALALANRQNTATGAVLGGLGAAASAYLFFNLRKSAVQTTGLPDTAVALVEDSLALAGGYRVLQG